jgi:hypothetical protein
MKPWVAMLEVLPMQDWPHLSEERDRPTIVTLHLISQIVGKVPAKLLPWRNHGWHLTLHVTPRGLATEPIHCDPGTFDVTLDLVDHALILELPRGTQAVDLPGKSIAQVRRELLDLLGRAGLPTQYHGSPNEVDPATPFDLDTEVRDYDPDSADRLRRALISADRVFRHFRSSFLGKVSPVHFFWGSFDLAVTRFSGRPAPRHPGGIPNLPDEITREAYSHEVSSAGFWPGGAGAPGGPFFYSYAYPVPQGFADVPVLPEAARFDGTLGEFVLDYEAVRTAADPDAALLAFLESSYRAAADLGQWDRDALECNLGEPGVPRLV